GLALRQETAPSVLHDVEHGSVIGDTDAPRRTELGPEVHAAAKTRTSQDVGEESCAPRLVNASRRNLRRGRARHSSHNSTTAYITPSPGLRSTLFLERPGRFRRAIKAKAMAACGPGGGRRQKKERCLDTASCNITPNCSATWIPGTAPESSPCVA